MCKNIMAHNVWEIPFLNRHLRERVDVRLVSDSEIRRIQLAEQQLREHPDQNYLGFKTHHYTQHKLIIMVANPHNYVFEF
jgi:hypothetical protein